MVLQSAKVNEEKLKSEEKLAKSKAKMKILEDLDVKEVERFHYDDVNSSQQLLKINCILLFFLDLLYTGG